MKWLTIACLLMALLSNDANGQSLYLDSIDSIKDKRQFDFVMNAWGVDSVDIEKWDSLPHGPQLTGEGDTLSIDFIEYEEFVRVVKYSYNPDKKVWVADTLVQKPELDGSR